MYYLKFYQYNATVVIYFSVYVPSTYTVPISAPQNLQSIATSETSITVQWDAVPCIDRNSEIAGYMLRYGEASSEAIPRSGGEGGMYTITGLSPLTTYYIEVAAVSDSGIGPFAGITVQTPLYRKATRET